MIVTLTANTTLDQTLFVPALRKNTTMRASHTVLTMGGKPTDASWILGELGIPSLAMGFAAGAFGEQAKAMLQAQGVHTDFIEVEGHTRLNVILMDESDHSHSTITTSSLIVLPDHLEQLEQKFADALSSASCVVMGGTLPAGLTPAFYARMIGMARDKGIPVVFDAAEPNLSVGLTASPTYAKPNRDELAGYAGYPVDSLEKAYEAGRRIVDKYGTCPIITLGDEGALAVLQDRAYRIPPLPIDVVSPAGAGDAVLAGLAASIERGQPIEEGLRLGAAAAAAVCLLPGTAVCRRADVERLLPQVELIPYP